MTKEEVMERFKQVCLEDHKLRVELNALGESEEDLDEADRIQDSMLDASEEQDWYSISLGFFKALGLSNEDCHSAAIEARYTYHYWCE